MTIPLTRGYESCITLWTLCLGPTVRTRTPRVRAVNRFTTRLFPSGPSWPDPVELEGVVSLWSYDLCAVSVCVASAGGSYAVVVYFSAAIDAGEHVAS